MQNILNGSQTFTSVCVVPTIIQNQSTWNISSTGLCSVACGVAHAPCWLEISGSDLAGGVFDLCRENTAYPQIAKVTLCCSSHETGVTYQYEEPKIKSTPGSWDLQGGWKSEGARDLELKTKLGSAIIRQAEGGTAGRSPRIHKVQVFMESGSLTVKQDGTKAYSSNVQAARSIGKILVSSPG